MNKVQTDNDEKYLKLKLKLRLDVVNKINSDNISVLDCFSGNGVLWETIKKLSDKKINVLRIEAKNTAKGIYLKGDNVKFLKNIDIHAFDIMDLDAYGIPDKQLEILFKREYKGFVVVTAIQSMMGRMSNKILNDLGYSKAMVRKVPTIFSKKGYKKISSWLANKGISEVYGKLDGLKNYFYFEVK